MHELQEIRSLLKEHSEESNKRHLELSTSLVEIKTHNEYMMKSIQDHNTEIEKLKAARNRQKGAIALLSFLGISGLIEWIRHTFK